MSKEEKARRRALAALHVGRRFIPRGDANKAILEQIRKSGDTVPSAARSGNEKKWTRSKQVEDPPATFSDGNDDHERDERGSNKKKRECSPQIESKPDILSPSQDEDYTKEQTDKLQRVMVKTTR